MVDVGQDTLAWTQSGPGGGAVLFERVTGKKKRTDAPPVHTNIFVLQTGFFKMFLFYFTKTTTETGFGNSELIKKK